jgi:hypothetical protein
MSGTVTAVLLNVDGTPADSDGLWPGHVNGAR